MTVKYDQKPGYKSDLVGHDFINIKAPNRVSLPRAHLARTFFCAFRHLTSTKHFIMRQKQLTLEICPIFF